jgi:hypothetical protein
MDELRLYRIIHPVRQSVYLSVFLHGVYNMTVHDDDDNDFVDDNGHTSNASDDEEEMDQYDDDEEEQKASNDDDEESRLLIMDIDTLYPLLVPLASSAWDVQSPRDRKAILQTIQNQLQHNPIARNFFAEQSKGRCQETQSNKKQKLHTAHDVAFL